MLMRLRPVKRPIVPPNRINWHEGNNLYTLYFTYGAKHVRKCNPDILHYLDHSWIGNLNYNLGHVTLNCGNTGKGQRLKRSTVTLVVIKQSDYNNTDHIL